MIRKEGKRWPLGSAGSDVSESETADGGLKGGLACVTTKEARDTYHGVIAIAHAP